MTKDRISLPMSARRPLLLLIDLLAVNVAFVLALFLNEFVIVEKPSGHSWSIGSALLLTLIYTALAFLLGCYDPYSASRMQSSWSKIFATVSIWIVALLALPRTLGTGPLFSFGLWLLALIQLSGWRAVYSRLFAQPVRYILLLGTEWPLRELAREIQESVNSGYELLGFVCADSMQQETNIAGVPVFGVDDIYEVVREYQPVDLAGLSEDTDLIKNAALFQVIHNFGIPTVSAVWLYERVTGRVLIDPKSGKCYDAQLAEGRAQESVFYDFLKRTFDLTLVMFCLITAMPLLFLVVIAIRLDSPGPTIYRQQSIGEHGRVFWRLKFRTLHMSSGGSSTNAPTLTRVGKILRRTALDELPQLINILQGDMSFVGPYPDRPGFLAEISNVLNYKLRYAARPGLTGWAQLHLVSEPRNLDPVTQSQYDLYYVKHRSLLLDLSILSRTVYAVFLGSVLTEVWVLESEWTKARRGLVSGDTKQFATGAEAVLQKLAQVAGLAISTRSVACKQFLVFEVDASQLLQGTKLHKRLPILGLMKCELEERDLDDARCILSELFPMIPHVALLLLFGEQDPFDQIVQVEVQRMRQAYAFDVVLLGRDSLRRLTMADDPRSELRRYVLSQVDIVTISPFVTTGPASSTMFFGREAHLREVTEQIAKTNYAIIGGRRIGKTSILKVLEGARLPTVGFKTVYHDCSFTRSEAELAEAIAHSAGWYPDAVEDTPRSFVRVVQLLRSDKPLVFLLDEVDKLIEPDRRADYSLFSTFRALANAGHCAFVLSGEQALRLELGNPNSPLYNFAAEMLIGRLDFRSVEELVIRPMQQLEIGLTDEREIVQRIWALSSGHPNVVQRLCQRLLVNLNQREERYLSLEDIEAVVADPDFLRKDFLGVYWERATVLERLCSLMMAADRQLHSLKEVQDALDRHDTRTTLHQVDDALERLSDLRNILQRTSEGYEFAVTAFPEVIARTSRLDDWIALNRETYQQYGDVEPRSTQGVL